MPTLPIWKVTSVRKMLIKCSSMFFPVSSISLPVLFCFLLPAGIGKHLVIYKPFLISPFAYQIDLEWAKCKWESGSPGEFLREGTHPSEVPHLCFVLLEGSVSLKCSEGRHSSATKGGCLCLGRFLTWREQEFGDSPSAQPHRSLYKVYLWLSSPTMSLIKSSIRHNILGWAFQCLGWVLGSF